MAPCTTTGTTWETCGHSIYQHQPSCKHRGNRCTKNSLLQPGICPSCTQIDYYPTSQPPRLPDHLSRSESLTPVEIKKEPVDEGENMALVKKEVMHPDEYLKSEYERHKKELAEKTGNVGIGSGAGSGLFSKIVMEEKGENMGPERGGLFDRITKRNLLGGGAFGNTAKEEQHSKDLFKRNINGSKARGEGGGAFGDAAKEERNGKEYFLEFHIKQLEEKLEAARLREAENNVQIGNLQAQVGLLREPPAERSYAASGSTQDTSSVSITCGSAEGSVAKHATQSKAEPTPLLLQPAPSKPFIDVRQQIRDNRAHVNNGYQAGGAQTRSQIQGGAPVNQGERGCQLQRVGQLDVSSPRSQGGRVKQEDKIPPLKEVVSDMHRDEKSAMVPRYALEGRVITRPTRDPWKLAQDVPERARNVQRADPAQKNNSQDGSQQGAALPTEAQSNNQTPTNGVQVATPQAPIAPAVEDATKKQLFDIAAISFSSQLTIKLINLKDALDINELDTWFDLQVAHSFKCAQELNFHSILTGYKTFVDWVGERLLNVAPARLEEEKIQSTLGECEKMVQILMDVEAIITAST